ncbi:hypothetical protein D3C72_1243970 [compost metagenome]
MNRFRVLANRRLPSGRLFSDLGRDIVAVVLTIAAAFAVASAYHAAERADVAPAPAAEVRP